MFHFVCFGQKHFHMVFQCRIYYLAIRLVTLLHIGMEYFAFLLFDSLCFDSLVVILVFGSLYFGSPGGLSLIHI